MEIFADVIVSLPVDGVFTYSVPGRLKDDVAVGKMVLVPFGKRPAVTGYVVALKRHAQAKGLKPISDVLDDAPVFDEKRLKFYRWLSSYYLAPAGEVFSLTHPPSLNIRSRRYFSITGKGEEALSDPGADGSFFPGRGALLKDVLAAVKGGVYLTALLKRFKGRSVYGAVARLKKEGLITEEARVKGAGKKTERFAAIPAGVRCREAFSGLENSPLQKRLFGYLMEKGETPLTVLRGEMAGVDGALKRLEEKGYACCLGREVLRDPFRDIPERIADHELNEEQKEALGEMLKTLGHGYHPYLLYGVTGSGKTLVYIRVIEEAVRAGKKAIFLVPEIALTLTPAAYLSQRFPARVALLHSSLSEGERHDEWQRIQRGDADVVVGARSALFAPVRDLGVIIVDEEHDPSYKDEQGVRYNARDAALMLGKILGITVILGSATPSIETFYNARNGKLKPLYLKKRVEGGRMPEIELLDMKGVKGSFISDRLKGLMKETIEGNAQVLLFLNRRGFSSFLACRDCGYAVRCLNCSVTLTIHKEGRVLKCHYCDYTRALPEVCPECKGHNLKDPGVGTEKVEEEVRSLFPGVGVARLDRDSSRMKGQAARIIAAVEERKVSVLIGTQMVSKGHHFPGIALVGVISGDTSLNVPDFRGAERTFHLISQASGRAGRAGQASRVVVQTLNPEHFCFKSVKRHDYEGFFEEEMKAREDADYPPCVRLASLRVEGAREGAVEKAAGELRAIAEKLTGHKGRLEGHKGRLEGITVLGPVPCLIPKLRGRWRWQMLFKCKDSGRLNGFLSALKGGFEKTGQRGVSLIIDVDPATTV
ncbi:MAG: primosomal protein N' [Deltaproteobacteria bacterium]|nr:primosomal protein N' [Deltaproteobacteria bacterium]